MAALPRKLLLMLLLMLIPGVAQAFGHGGRWYGGYSRGYWPQGDWFHGAYSGRAGWWWIVGPSWYYYPAPVYPYPPETKSLSKSQAFSYYCKKSKSYYPVVNTCAEGWVATPVPAPGGQ
jgi:hypothetical protein